MQEKFKKVFVVIIIIFIKIAIIHVFFYKIE